MRRFPLVLFLVLLAGAALFITATAGQLPEIVAVHFDAAGHANGYMTRAGCRSFMLTLSIAAPALIVIATALLPRLLPASMINIPNRDYWLAAERAPQSLAFLGEQGIWFGCIFVVFITAVDWMLVRANAVVPPSFPTTLFIATLMFFFCAIGIWAARMFRRFRAPR
ncbi:MAG TPA: DUF1648 domain-containing protein [Steroidobacteraceae bacterium]|nr:DUF1648 domain-containing protein [Steroidobacteraceae bacterium]